MFFTTLLRALKPENSEKQKHRNHSFRKRSRTKFRKNVKENKIKYIFTAIKKLGKRNTFYLKDKILNVDKTN